MNLTECILKNVALWLIHRKPVTKERELTFLSFGFEPFGLFFLSEVFEVGAVLGCGGKEMKTFIEVGAGAWWLWVVISLPMLQHYQ